MYHKKDMSYDSQIRDLKKRRTEYKKTIEEIDKAIELYCNAQEELAKSVGVKKCEELSKKVDEKIEDLKSLRKELQGKIDICDRRISSLQSAKENEAKEKAKA